MQHDNDIYDVEAEAEADKELCAVIDGKFCGDGDSGECIGSDRTLHSLVSGKKENIIGN